MRPNYLDWQEVGIGKNIVYMISVGIVAIAVLAVIESNTIRYLQMFSRKRASAAGTRDVDDQEDEDVKAEREQVSSATVDCSNGLLIRYFYVLNKATAHKEKILTAIISNQRLVQVVWLLISSEKAGCWHQERRMLRIVGVMQN